MFCLGVYTLLAQMLVMVFLLMLILLAGSVPVGLMLGAGSEWLLYGLTLLTGAVVAMQFIAVSLLMQLQGDSTGTAAGRVWLADHQDWPAKYRNSGRICRGDCSQRLPAKTL
jgi:hypothetical protein